MGSACCTSVSLVRCLTRPFVKLKRRQLLCYFIIFTVVPMISLLFYLLKGVLSDTVQKEQCSFMFNDTTKGPIKADTDTVPSFMDLEYDFGHALLLGGHFIPKTCRSRYRVAIIVPFRDRQVHLKIFLRHMHSFLQRQNVEYGIIVVEQEAGTPFNRAILLNIGYVESRKLHDYNCFVFHDVDLVPLDDRNFYSCAEEPVHLSATIDAHDNKLMYQNIFGGASMLTTEMMEKVNGFSNVYFGWGGEDDDLSYRIRSHAMLIVRYAPEIATYTMMKHAKENKEDRSRLFATSRSRIHKDGLNSLEYELLNRKLLPLYTWLYVRVNQTKILEAQGLPIT